MFVSCLVLFYSSPQYRLKKHHKNHQSKIVSKIMILVINEMKWDGKNIHANNTKHIINYLTIAKKLVKKTVSIAKSDCESIVKIRLLQRIHLPIVKIISISSIKNRFKIPAQSNWNSIIYHSRWNFILEKCDEGS